MFKTKLILLSILFITCKCLYAKENLFAEWEKNFQLILELPLKDNSWGYTHPFIGSGVTYHETETGSFKSKTLVKTQLEFSKKYFGFGFGVGFYPADIKVNKTEELYSINSILAELETLIYPFGYTNWNLVPTITLGVGGVISSGDIDTSALFYSLGLGIKIIITEKIRAKLALLNRNFTFDEIPLTPEITGDIKFNSHSLHIGLIYDFN